LILQLTDAVSGLLFTSESDYPLTVFELPAVSVNIENAVSVLLPATDCEHHQFWIEEPSVETSTLEWFFDRYTVVQDWWEPSQLLDLERWQLLRDIFSSADSMTNVEVFRIGQSTAYGLSGSIAVFVIGQCTATGALLGVHTIAVET
jgi:Nuclease A inhibitor-like protein